MRLQCSDSVFQAASVTLIPCVLTDGEEIAEQKQLPPEDLIEYQQDVSVTTGDNWVWVESCIKPIGANNWLVFDANGNQINCVDVFFDGMRHIYSTVIKNVRHEFRHRPYAVAAILADNQVK